MNNHNDHAAAKRGRAARRKGAQFERDLVVSLRADLLRAGGNYTVQRGLQSAGGRCNPDVGIRLTATQTPLIHGEAKKGRRPPPARRALQQAIDDAAVGAVPVAITKADGDISMVSMRWDNWVEFLLAWLDREEP